MYFIRCYSSFSQYATYIGIFCIRQFTEYLCKLQGFLMELNSRWATKICDSERRLTSFQMSVNIFKESHMSLKSGVSPSKSLLMCARASCFLLMSAKLACWFARSSAASADAKCESLEENTFSRVTHLYARWPIQWWLRLPRQIARAARKCLVQGPSWKSGTYIPPGTDSYETQSYGNLIGNYVRL